MDKVGCYPFMAEPFHCDFNGRLFMGHLGNHMLNAADFHSSARGFGMKYLMSIQCSWVLSRLAIEMKEVPCAILPPVTSLLSVRMAKPTATDAVSGR